LKLGESEFPFERRLHRAKRHEHSDFLPGVLGEEVGQRFLPIAQLDCKVAHKLRDYSQTPDQFLSRLPPLQPAAEGLEVFVDVVKDDAEFTSL
jgi:hypothetical protein